MISLEAEELTLALEELADEEIASFWLLEEELFVIPVWIAEDESLALLSTSTEEDDPALETLLSLLAALLCASSDTEFVFWTETSFTLAFALTFPLTTYELPINANVASETTIQFFFTFLRIFLSLFLLNYSCYKAYLHIP